MKFAGCAKAPFLLLTGLGFLLASCAAPVQAGDTQCQSVSPGERSVEIRHGGLTRSALVYHPASIKPGQRAPAVLALHGGYGTGKHMRKTIGLDALADAQGLVAVYPDGKNRAWNAGDCCGKALEKNIDDVGFLTALMDRIQAEDCVDPGQIYVVGMSNGGGMAHRLSCEAPRRVAGIAMVSAVPMTPVCAQQPYVPTLLVIGAKDERVPWGGGKVEDGRARPPVDGTVEKLREQGRCAKERSEFRKTHGATCWTWSSCTTGALGLCRVDEGSHEWPGGKGRLFGGAPTDSGLSATQTAWDFFRNAKK